MIKYYMSTISLITIMVLSDYTFFPVGTDKESFSGNIAITTNPVQEGLNIGNNAPDLAVTSPDGKILKLSSLRGKIVLIDFWASWCLPCRNENPNLVKFYKQYKDAAFNNGSGFTIYSISIDKDKARWLTAIKDDNLIWKNHVSDLKGGDSEPAAKYNINAIPSNFLIDGNGVIIAVNLRGEALDSKLKSLLK